MDFKTFEIEGLVEFQPRVFRDDRGYFLETFSMKWFEPLGIKPNFVQDNQSVSKKGVLRGLHFQKPPYAQGKLVRVSSGRALDVAVDLRKNSLTYGKHVTCILDATQQNVFYVPEGFAHGFVALEDDTTFLYKCTDYYQPSAEGGLLWNDPELGIDWGVENPLVSTKDEVLPLLRNFESPF
ncbi:dTDP-4-dehydrorhamnose 3,5-epimerase [Pontibacter sp. BT310]|uniref:dTDP-4-dehydrorhamnose 3,5-epimerase n=1 Tax=Pontibacter populi TaxID=890055 RepID=A0ABS6XFT9_9BACT|nr:MULTISPECIES: dTDP-4-dehydrorhamnose 3,5-epimerase [Pontibacter]MBJ6119929.1 dTDP-4-dehydrorhamnose 3,5-epimerase [Pontibacter sp. BT310]MBR0572358.1 dTDP-4-dehydrorhamnose 3,5-epimerase [Microvirga sp. STS03]MBW3366782.1 dTDP-4-dehydrorhamnose 3,5-epimerase [Pontibacter populi]